jgi:gamma-glutamyltranspeptidase/glutathione hydrolase
MPHRLEFASCGLIIFLATMVWLGLTSQQPAWGQDRPAGPLHKTRSTVMARQGMAATSQPLATMTAIDILKRGGNAIDAAIAANAVLGVVEPMSCGIGGDLFAIVWDAKTQKLIGLNASGRSPTSTSIELFKTKGLAVIPTHGPLSWSVPGCVDGWDQLHKRFGTKAFSELLAPAIAYAETGFPVSEIIAADWQGAETSLKAIPTSSACYLPGGHAPGKGTIFRNPALARSLRAIAQEGRDAFYRGALADAMVRYSQAAGGLFSHSDFAEHTTQFVDPVSTNYRGYDVWELPPNTQGIAVLQMLNLLEPFDLKSMGPKSAEALHLMIEAKKLAYEDRAKFYADPDFRPLPIATLISKPYADRRRAALNPDKANLHPVPGDPAQTDTIYMTVVDKDFNCVSLIQSNFHGFGSHHVPGDLGFVIQNRGSLFALDPKHLNRLEPRKRPFQTIIPGFITKDGKPWLSFGLMGGDMQAQGHVQVICNLIDFGMDVQEAGDAARFRHFGSSEPTGQPANGGGMVALESGIPPTVRSQLEAKGHRLVDAPGTYGGYQAIRIDLEHGVLSAGSDPRKDGAAMGY